MSKEYNKLIEEIEQLQAEIQLLKEHNAILIQRLKQESMDELDLVESDPKSIPFFLKD